MSLRKTHMLNIAIIAIGLLLSLSALYAQSVSELEKISQSQGAASSLIFKVEDQALADIWPGRYSNDRECTVRGGLPYFFAKLDAHKDVTVAFVGGSITQGQYCYRLQTAKSLKKYLKNGDAGSKFTWVNAGVSGTGTDLGAFRLREQVLRYKPDLIFIEFAVNGAYRAGLEGMIRQIRKDNPETDICLLYSILTSQGIIYQRDSIPENIQGLETLASYYQLPSVHLGMEAAACEAQGKLLWKGTKAEAGSKLLFSRDGIHPLEAGGNLYAAAIVRGLEKMEKMYTRDKAVVQVQRSLPLPLISDSWTAANMYEPSTIAQFDGSWQKLNAYDSPAHMHLKQFQGWFPTMMTADAPGATCRFSFTGDMFGLFDIGGPEVGQLEVFVDGKRVGLHKVAEQGFSCYRATDTNNLTSTNLLNRFNGFCNNRYRGQYDVIKVPPGTHRVTLKVSPVKADKKAILGPGQLEDIRLNPDKYNRTAVYIGRILLRGAPIYQDGN